jgi:periplasmic copper chaperone A
MTTKRPRSLRAVAIGAATAAFLTVGLDAASAHVSVTPDATDEGGYTQLTFKVPSESKTATTTTIRVDLPTATPFTSVRVKPVPGWTAEIAKGKLPQPVTVDGATVTEAPLSVTWTANDVQSQLTEDQYQAFSLSVGRLPKAGTTVLLPAAQTYSDGSVRNWDDPVVAGQGEPQDPAPSFTTTVSSTSQHGHASATAAETAVVPAASVSTEAARPALTWVAFAAGLLGLTAGVAAFLRAGRTRKG